MYEGEKGTVSSALHPSDRMHFPLLLVVAALALPAAAQSGLSDGPGTYAAMNDFQLSSGQDDLTGLGMGGEIGYRFEGGFDVGLIGSLGRNRTDSNVNSDAWMAGVTAGLTRSALFGTVARLQAVAAVEIVDLTLSRGTMSTESYSYSTAVGDVSATLGRTIPVIGSVRIRPTAGLYARVENNLSFEGRGRYADTNPGSNFDSGLQFELPITFRVLGVDAAFVPSARMSFGEPLGSDRIRSMVPTGGFRLNF